MHAMPLINSASLVYMVKQPLFSCWERCHWLFCNYLQCVRHVGGELQLGLTLAWSKVNRTAGNTCVDNGCEHGWTNSWSVGSIVMMRKDPRQELMPVPFCIPWKSEFSGSEVTEQYLSIYPSAGRNLWAGRVQTACCWITGCLQGSSDPGGSLACLFYVCLGDAMP